MEDPRALKGVSKVARENIACLGQTRRPPRPFKYKEQEYPMCNNNKGLQKSSFCKPLFVAVKAAGDFYLFISTYLM